MTNSAPIFWSQPLGEQATSLTLPRIAAGFRGPGVQGAADRGDLAGVVAVVSHHLPEDRLQRIQAAGLLVEGFVDWIRFDDRVLGRGDWASLANSERNQERSRFR